MFVPFVFSLDVRSDLYYLWIFYKFLDMARRYNTPFIAQEKYFVDPEIYADMGKNEVNNSYWRYVNEYDRPLTGDLVEITKYPFPKEIEDRIVMEKGSQTAAWMFLLSERYEPFEVCIERMFLEIVSNSSEKIEGILTFCHIPSLSYVAAKLNIPVMHLEWGPLRTPSYRKTAYLDFVGVHGPNELERRFALFTEESKELPNNYYFTRKELLSLFLDYGVLHNINLADQKTEYDLGLATSYACDNNIMVNSSFLNDVELVTLAKRCYEEDNIILRNHPGDPLHAKYNIRNIDNSPSSMQFICKCNKIAVIHSNLAFEAMLLGRTTYVLGKSLYRFKALTNLDDKREMQADLPFLNYIVFAYLIPYELMLDVDYLRWRCTNPSEVEIYNKHLMYYLKCRGVDHSILEVPSTQRLEEILNAQGFDSNGMPLPYNYDACDVQEGTRYNSDDYLSSLELNAKIQKLNKTIFFMNQQLEETVNDQNGKISQINKFHEEQINQLEIDLSSARFQINEIYNTLSWRLTKPLRLIRSYLAR